MTAAQILSPREGRVFDSPPPTPAPDEVVIEVHNAGICGTDLHIWHGSYALARYPVVPGHEFSGVVSAVGDAVKQVRVGDRVTADPNLPCGYCTPCQRNEPNQCLNLEVVGVTRNGAFARFVVVPESAVIPIGEMPFSAAALVEPLACVVWGLQRIQVQAGDKVLLFGAGPMGCLLVQALKHSGAAQVVVVDQQPKRLELAAYLGADQTVLANELSNALTADSFDIVADATGVPAVIEAAFSYARPRGKIWIFGVAPSGARASFSPYEVFRKDLSIIGSFAVNRTFHQSVALIRSGAIQVEPLVSHRLPLEHFEEGIKLAESGPDSMKVQFTAE